MTRCRSIITFGIAGRKCPATLPRPEKCLVDTAALLPRRNSTHRPARQKWGKPSCHEIHRCTLCSKEAR
eukprot:135175-Pleurochrysis_carterae.AAC.4